MTKENLLKIFGLEELYYHKEAYMPFLYNFTDFKNHSDNFITFYFYSDQINIYVSSKNFSVDNSEKELKLTFNIKDNELVLSKQKNEFSNEMFPHLDFTDNLLQDLEFVSGIINNVLINKYDMVWSYTKL